MSTRVTNAASKRAKATLIELLFPRQQAKRYSHLQLRMAYLQKVHIMHPDKQRLSSSTRDESAHEKFVQLQNAWEAYNISARMFRKTNHGKRKQGENSDDGNDDFTMFGVGCSFSDSPEERRLRDEIMEQACRGWLPSGALSHSFDATEKAKKEVKSPQQATKLSDDNLFIQQQTSEESIGSTNVQNVNTKKSLVQNVENYRNRIKRKP
ncbi:hypothetical protein QTG54_011072 [Skeletonema marinoi]|uniref:J domain-containing protein n=1 Tax=Skeletonema marinoi TaxID=267567 RepID=A0AAD9DA61_9STRA|nr:hypothetical protein QTG54_011072 [Skeletonema marinoi]